MILVTEINSIMKMKKISQIKLSHDTGLHKNTICYILKGKVSTSHESIMKILLALKVDFNELYGKVYPMTKTQDREKKSNEALVESFVADFIQKNVSKSEIMDLIDQIWDKQAKLHCSR
jgi:transcriptional regulator with XRE-family HTH domain